MGTGQPVNRLLRRLPIRCSSRRSRSSRSHNARDRALVAPTQHSDTGTNRAIDNARSRQYVVTWPWTSLTPKPSDGRRDADARVSIGR